jgi:hypothetical protein
MKRFRLAAIAGSVLLAAAVAIGPVYAQNTNAYNTRYITSITYQNVGSGQATIQLELFAENAATGIPVAVNPLNQGAGTSLSISSISDVSSQFKGAGVMSSDEPIVATMVQVPSGGPVLNRPLSNGFGPDDGAADFLIATVLKNAFTGAQTTQFSVQNVDSVAADLTVRFIDANSTPPGTVVHTIPVTNLAPGSVRYFDAGLISQLGTTFNGSATINAVRTGTTTPGRVVATALELDSTSINASSFEGLVGGSAGGSNTVYMPSALCNAFGGQQTAYAVQNTEAPGGQVANVTVTYKVRPANNSAAPIETFVVPAVAIQPSAKASFAGCTTLPAGYTGSATIQSTGGKIVAIQKVVGGGISAATPGATGGAARLALPYVRYTTSFFVNPDAFGRRRQITSIAIQNVGGADIPANSITIKYIDKNGVQVGTTHTIGTILPAGEKVNSNPTNAGTAANEFGAYDDGTFGGSALIECSAPGCELVAAARVISYNPATGLPVGEDYNGIPVATAN